MIRVCAVHYSLRGKRAGGEEDQLKAIEDQYGQTYTEIITGLKTQV